MVNFLSLRAITLLFAVVSFSSLAIQEVREPEAATGVTVKNAVTGKKYMVATANSYATQAGFDMLAKSGSAIDAAIAAQMVLTLVEPQSSGIGGGAFILHWQAKNKQLTTFDGREVAPENVNEELFLDKNKRPIPWHEAVVGGKSVGVPGVLAVLKKAHEQYGKLPWAQLFEPAIKLAEQGFVVSPRLAKLVSLQLNPGVEKLSNIHQYFYPNGKVISAGETLINKPLAKVFKSLAKEGIEPFYQGWIAKNIVDSVQNSEVAPGKLSLRDLANYQAKERKPVCAPYRHYNICGMAPPSSGGITVIQLVKMLATFELQNRSFNDPQTWHLFSQSSRLAFADRELYIADPDFVQVPTQGLISDNYLAQRAKLIDQTHDNKNVQAGFPQGALAQAKDNAYELPSTSHLSIVDEQGNAISMTTSIEMAFGSAVMVDGFILNNQLTDFSFIPEVAGKLVANRVAPLKRPRSSMAPMMVFAQDGSLKLVLGSPGGSRIINYVAKTMLGVLDWQLNVQQAINLPNITNRNKVTTLEKGTAAEAFSQALTKQGHKVIIQDLNSGVHAIEVKNEVLIGGADPRREGLVLAK